MPKHKKVSTKKSKNWQDRVFIVAALVLTVGLGIWSLSRSLFAPVDINLVADSQQYDDSRCIKVTGSCINPTSGQCVPYTNECEGMRVCGGIPWKACKMSESVQPVVPTGCYYKRVQCIQEPCNPMLICESPAPSTATPKPEMCTQ
jgi:hypothetical protein